MTTLKPIPPEVKRMRRIKKYLKRLILVAAMALFYFFLLPKISPKYAPSVEKNKEMILESAKNARTQISQILGTATQIEEKLTGEKEKLEGQGPEALIRQTVDDLTQRVKALPKEQVQKVKREFCSDVIKEATLASEEQRKME